MQSWKKNELSGLITHFQSFKIMIYIALKILSPVIDCILFISTVTCSYNTTYLFENNLATDCILQIIFDSLKSDSNNSIFVMHNRHLAFGNEHKLWFITKSTRIL